MAPTPHLTGTTIAVTSANSSTGKRLLTCLTSTSAAVTALVRHPADLPADAIITDWTRSPDAPSAIGQADVIIHLSGVFNGPDWQTYHEGTVQTAERVADATRAGQRLLYLSYVDADPESANWYERAKGRAEQALTKSAADVLILRIPPILYGTDQPGAFERRMLAEHSGAPVTVIGDGTKHFRPLYSGDIINALIAACTSTATGIYDLVGPENLTINDIIRRINGPTASMRHLPVEAARQIPAIPDTAIDLFTKPGREPDPTTAWHALGITPTPLNTIWRPNPSPHPPTNP
jgi:uncharacterized protein YbjT (DUF2867 family)